MLMASLDQEIRRQLQESAAVKQAFSDELIRRIAQFAEIVGRDRVIAGTDCGFGTFAGMGKLEPEMIYKKLRSLVEGAAIASARLWKRASATARYAN